MSDAICAWITRGYISSNRRAMCQRTFVLYMIGRSANNQGWAVGESFELLGQSVRLSARQVMRHVRLLESEGVLKHFEQHDDRGGQKANLYRVLMPGIDEKMPPPKLPSANGHLSPREQAEQLIASTARKVSRER
jgi:hypothetical protein